MINNFTDNWTVPLTENERFVLYAAAWLHDIGCIRDRDDHNMYSIDILLRDHDTCNYLDTIDSNLLRVLRYVIESHSKSHCPYGIDEIPEKVGPARARLLAAIFRLMDACEITKYKCPPHVFAEIRGDLTKEDENKKRIPDTKAIEFWEGHMSISYLGFNKPAIEIFINDAIKTKSIIDGLNEEIRSIEHVFHDNGMDVPVVMPIESQVGIDRAE
ncbi:MAG: hypothetical protein GYA23_02910 [Methanomicrobiales archaeon]|nr:hypothetical protein [Methanomicrobiales archaeon]